MENLTPEPEIMNCFQISRSTLWKWRKEGCPSVKIGRKVYYSIDALVEWWREQEERNNGCIA